MKKIYILFLSLVTLINCTNNEENIRTKTIIVASEQRSCQAFIPQTCFLIKENENDSWQFFYDEIKGFTYEEGFEYKLLVSEEEIYPVPEDASSIKRTLLEVILKEKKDSDNLPERESVIINEQAYNNTNTNNYSIKKAFINEGKLFVIIAASGCNAKNWITQLIVSEEIKESNPPIRLAKLKLINKEACLAVFDKEYIFDLEKIKLNGTSLKLDLKNWNEELIYNY